jgi:hypothetical protein
MEHRFAQMNLLSSNYHSGDFASHIDAAIWLLADKIPRQSSSGPRPAPSHRTLFKQIDDSVTIS